MAFAAVDEDDVGQAGGGWGAAFGACLGACLGGGLFGCLLACLLGGAGLCAGVGLGEFAVAAQQDLAHGGVVVARGDVGDVVAAVLGGLHGVALKDDA